MSHLSAEQKKHFERKLRDREQALLADIDREADKNEGYMDTAPEVPDAGDASVSDHIQALNQAEISRDLQEQRAVAAALQRLQTGEYGICVDCGMDIPIERLEVVPEAERCTPCQSAYERTHASGNVGATL
jgi:RNA polymerase-binding protein DksA